ncbi:MAG: alpha/beta hydrolase [Deinococcota bacterium]
MLKLILVGVLIAGLLAALAKVNAWLVRRYQQVPDPTGYFVNIRGQALYAKVSGNVIGEGVSVLMLTDVGVPSAVWWPLQDALMRVAPASMSCLSYDRPGLGWSKGEPGRAGQAAQDLRALSVALKLEPPYVLVADGYGALVAAHFASQYPDDTRGLVLTEPYVPPSALRTLVDKRTYTRLFAPGAMTMGSSILARLGLARFTPLPYPLPDNLKLHWREMRASPSAVAAMTSELNSAEADYKQLSIHNQLTPQDQSLSLALPADLAVTVIMPDVHNLSEFYYQQKLEEAQIRRAVEAQFQLARGYLAADDELILVVGHPSYIHAHDDIISAVLNLAKPRSTFVSSS